MVAIIDAEGAVLGRLCTVVAKRLLNGEEIAVVNSEKAIVTGKKVMIKAHYKHEREVGTYRKGPFYPRMPDRILKRTIRGMIPYQEPHGRTAFKRLRCYIGIPKDMQGQTYEKITVAEKYPTNYMTLQEVAQFLGAKVYHE
ncbi:MAG TPA: 50S ribosomal protein L13 [Candidatus Thermoplasmatota archaeon]|nr:50S ribosomal protein L13 [Candidatus Thermoplasmatota archaeon]